MGDDDDAWEAMFARMQGGATAKRARPQVQQDQVPVKKARKEVVAPSPGLEEWLSRVESGKLSEEEQGALKRHREAVGELSGQLGKKGGLKRLRHFLPSPIAEEITQVLEGLSAADWTLACDEFDRFKGTTSHRYGVGVGGESKLACRCIDSIISVIKMLLPPHVEGSFQASRYSQNHFIEPHNDFAQKRIQGKMYCRDIAIVFYLTKDWTLDLGGTFIDMQASKDYVPEFNSLIAFKVPRLHQVTPVVTTRNRFSVFGWFYRPDAAAEKGAKRKKNNNNNNNNKKKKKKKKKKG